MLLQCPLRGHHGRLGLVFRLEVQTLASVPVLQTLALHLDAVLRRLGEVLHRQVLVLLVLVLLVVVLLVLVLPRQVLVLLVVVAPCPDLQQRGCCQVEPSGEVFPCPGSKKMDCCLGEVCQALLRRRTSPPRPVLRLPMGRPALAQLQREAQ
jgi:hypothetical protein